MTEVATFALGCFWEPDDYFSKLKGVLKTRVGYTGGTKENPSYYKLGDHTESVEITFDPEFITYKELLGHFWKEHDPARRCSTQYMSAIFTHGQEQDTQARESMVEEQKRLSEPIQTRIEAAGKFYEAEGYHQKYLSKTGNKTC